MAIFADGAKVSITFAQGSLSVGVVGLQPTALDTGEPIEITTLNNSNIKTYLAPTFKDLRELKLTCQYGSATLTALLAQLGVNQLVTVTWSDTKTWTFYGYIRSATPNEMTAGKLPTMEIVVQPTNVHSSTSAETLPVES